MQPVTYANFPYHYHIELTEKARDMDADPNATKEERDEAHALVAVCLFAACCRSHCLRAETMDADPSEPQASRHGQEGGGGQEGEAGGAPNCLGLGT
jgi:hypothetical protein